MKIGVISDTHIPDKAEALSKEIIKAFKDVDMVVHAGDLIDERVLVQLNAVCKDVRAVWGNMDPDEVRARLTEREIIQIGKFRVGIVHGFGPPADLPERLKEIFQGEKVDLVIFGHSHQPTKIVKDGVIYFNPGSATDDMFAPYKSYGIIEINDKITTKIVKIS